MGQLPGAIGDHAGDVFDQDLHDMLKGVVVVVQHDHATRWIGRSDLLSLHDGLAAGRGADGADGLHLETASRSVLSLGHGPG